MFLKEHTLEIPEYTISRSSKLICDEIDELTDNNINNEITEDTLTESDEQVTEQFSNANFQEGDDLYNGTLPYPSFALFYFHSKF